MCSLSFTHIIMAVKTKLTMVKMEYPKAGTHTHSSVIISSTASETKGIKTFSNYTHSSSIEHLLGVKYEGVIKPNPRDVLFFL